MVTTSSFNAEGGKLIIRIRVLEKERRTDRLKKDDRRQGKIWCRLRNGERKKGRAKKLKIERKS